MNPREFISSIPSVSKLRIMSEAEKFDVIKDVDNLFGSLAEGYISPISNIKTVEDYKEYLSSSSVVKSDEEVRLRDIFRNAAILKDFVGRFDELPNALDGESQMHLNDSLRKAIFEKRTGLNIDITLSDNQGTLTVCSQNKKVNLPFYLALQDDVAWAADEEVLIRKGPIALDPSLMSEIPRLAKALSEIIIAKTDKQLGLVIDDFTIQHHEVDEYFFSNYFSEDNALATELSQFVSQRGVEVTPDVSSPKYNDHGLSA